VSEIASRRAIANAFAVRIKNKPVVGANVHDVFGGSGCQRKSGTEMQYKRLAEWCGWMGNPARSPARPEGRDWERH
jgi:hypothetical protein